jgi:Uma2 family endonuclease
MAETMVEPVSVVQAPDITHLVTEDDTPVDNLPSEKQQRLLVEPLYSSWKSDQPFVAAANVGVFSAVNRSPLVPDVFLSLDVQVAENWWAKEHRSYFVWEFGKPPDVVVEIVSNTKGEETSKKLREYARMGIRYYVIYDPQRSVQEDVLKVYELHVGNYVARKDGWMEMVGLGLTLWEGVFEEKRDQWLRWCDREGRIIPTGTERAEQERERAERERERAEQEQKRAEQERERAEQERERAEREQKRAEQEQKRAERLAARLKALGIDPEG